MRKYIPLKEPIDWYHELEVSLSYELWGMNYFNGQSSHRWIYVHMKPAEHITDAEGRTIWHKFTLFKWFKVLVKELKRKSAKQYKTISDLMIEKYTDKDYLEMFQEKSKDKIFAMKDYLFINS